MYFSQNAVILILLLFVTTIILFKGIEYKTENVQDEIKLKKYFLVMDNIESSLKRDIDKIVLDAFINTSYKIMDERKFFNNSDEAVNYIESLIKNETNKSLTQLSKDYNIKINYINVTILPTDNPLYVNVKLTANFEYPIENLNNVIISKDFTVSINKNIKLSRVPDPYLYLNNFYYTWEYYRVITINNFPNNNKNHTFCIILNSSNFNYSHMYNSSSPREIRIIGANNVLLPYWVQVWRYGNNEVSLIWVKANKNQLFNGNEIYLLYNSTTTIDKQNPYETFILFDDFNDLDLNKWYVVGNYKINNSILTVEGLGSSVYSKNNFSTGYELVFRGNFTPIHAQSVGFFKPLSDYIGVGWDCYKWDASNRWLYMRNDTSYWGDNWVNNGYLYLNEFYIYDVVRYNNIIQFLIKNNDNNILHEFRTTTNVTDSYPISINTLSNYTAKVSIDWIFVKDVNNITTEVENEYTNPTYKELKPKTFNGTIYYGDPNLYVEVNNGSYSIIGLYTNKSDSWGDVGFKPIIENN
ncbi:DUF2341 domain-containing protein [Methanocaldococcus indicus]|uniref:DUF2341 domain-containing protein n=1 Tax=Methanocaldococcus indicus TaxID=213231 RepID=UPI003C6D310C